MCFNDIIYNLVATSVPGKIGCELYSQSRKTRLQIIWAGKG